MTALAHLPMTSRHKLLRRAAVVLRRRGKALISRLTDLRRDGGFRCRGTFSTALRCGPVIKAISWESSGILSPGRAIGTRDASGANGDSPPSVPAQGMNVALRNGNPHGMKLAVGF